MAAARALAEAAAANRIVLDPGIIRAISLLSQIPNPLKRLDGSLVPAAVAVGMQLAELLAADPTQPLLVEMVAQVLLRDESGELVERAHRRHAAVLPALAAVLSTAPGLRPPSPVDPALLVLRIAAGRTSMHAALLEPGVQLVPRLLTLVRRDRRDASKLGNVNAACHTLSLLVVSGDASVAAVVGWGTLYEMVDLAAAGSDAVVSIAFRLLSDLADAGKGAFCDRIVAAGVLPRLFGALARRARDMSEAAYCACMLAMHLSNGSAPRAQAIAAAGILPFLVRALGPAVPDETAFMAACAIHVMALVFAPPQQYVCPPSAPPAVVRRLVDAGALGALTAMLSRRRRATTCRSLPSLAREAAGALCFIGRATTGMPDRILGIPGALPGLIAQLDVEGPDDLFRSIIYFLGGVAEYGGSEAFAALVASVAPARLSCVLAERPPPTELSEVPEFVGLQCDSMYAMIAILERGLKYVTPATVDITHKGLRRLRQLGSSNPRYASLVDAAVAAEHRLLAALSAAGGGGGGG
jgi:hypothetical protein